MTQANELNHAASITSDEIGPETESPKLSIIEAAGRRKASFSTQTDWNESYNDIYFGIINLFYTLSSIPI